MVDTKALGKAGLSGWRETVADAVANPISQRSDRLDEDQIRALVGALFLALSVWYVVQTFRRMLDSQT